MPSAMNHISDGRLGKSPHSSLLFRIGRSRSGQVRTVPARTILMLGAAGFLVITSCSVQAQSSTSQTPLSNPPPRPTGILLPAVNRVPDANDQMEMREQQNKTQDYAAANAERKKQIADDAAKLLKLASDLRAEVEKTDKDTLSLNVMRKADEIERLAHYVKEKMKLTAGGS